jgi:transcriptional regulator with AAA-type ATPase domain
LDISRPPHIDLKNLIPRLEAITGRKLAIGNIPFNPANLKRIHTLFDFYGSFLHNVVYYCHNNFQISYLVEVPGDGSYKEVESIEDGDSHSGLRQIQAVQLFASEQGLDFIDFSRVFVDPEGQLIFPVSFERRTAPLPEVSPEIPPEATDAEVEAGVEFFAYRFNDCAARIFQQYSLNNSDSHPNVRIRVDTSHPGLKRIIKIHLFQQYTARDYLLLFPPEDYNQLTDYLGGIFELEDGCDPEDLSGIAAEFKKYKHRSSKHGIVVIADDLDKASRGFFNYLLDASGCRRISFVWLGNGGLDDCDLELREKAPNLMEPYIPKKKDRKFDLESGEQEVLKVFCSLNFPVPQKWISRLLPNLSADALDTLIQKNVLCRTNGHVMLNRELQRQCRTLNPKEKLAILERLLLIEDSSVLRLNMLAEAGDWKGVKHFLRDHLQQDEVSFYCHGHVLYNYRRHLFEDDELLVLAVENLFREGDDEIVERLCEDRLAGKHAVLTLKKAHLLKYRRDHQEMYRLLKTLKGEIPLKLRDEYFYLNYIYFEKISDEERALSFKKKIQGDLYRWMAGIQESTRFIYSGRYTEAKEVLTDAIRHLKGRGYHRDALYAQSQMATLLRTREDFKGAERIYQNICIQAESRGFTLLGAYFAVDLGNLYVYSDDFPRAEYWYKRGLTVFQDLKNKNGVYLAKSNLMDVYKWKGSWRKVEHYNRSVLRFDRQKKLNQAMGVDYFNIAHLEYLKHNYARALTSVDEALTLFHQCRSHYCIIEGELLKIKILAASGKSYNLRNLEPFQEGFNRDQRVATTVLSIMGKSGLKDRREKFLHEIDGCQSRTLAFDLLALYIRLTGDRHLLENLKGCSLRLNDDSRNYFYFEYYYIYFECLNNVVELEGEFVDIFNEVYHFFSRNRRRLSDGIVRIKNYLDEKDSYEDIFQSADLVGHSHSWKVPEDFFHSFLSELRKTVRVDLVKLTVFENGERVFRFSDTNEFDTLTDELVDMAIQRAEHLTLDHDDILKLCGGAERAFYRYIFTRVLLWKISDRLFGVVVLGFASDLYRFFDVKDGLESLLKKFAPLLSRFYDLDYRCNETLAFIVGESQTVKKLKRQILKISKVDFAVLVNGESGSGKELVAKGIHLLSRRSSGPYVAVNAAAIPENLLEAELFGYMKGAFSGATDQRVGLIESADGGTLFLDEIGELPMNLQAKLLRVLQEKEIRRLGANGVKKVDVRLICATNKNLKEMCKQNLFREDLFYRIQDLTVVVPPLRDRLEDLPVLFRHFLEKYNFSLSSAVEFHAIASQWQGLEWPGNVRELESRVRRLITFYPDDVVETSPAPVEFSLKSERERFERDLLLRVLERHDWNKIRTAEQLKISRMSLFNLLKKYNIRRIDDE